MAQLIRWARLDYVLRRDGDRTPRLLTSLPLALFQFPGLLQCVQPPARWAAMYAFGLGFNAWPRWVDYVWIEVWQGSGTGSLELVREPLVARGSDPHLRQGFAVASPGDVNGDDVPDLLVGNLPESVDSSAGSAQLISGRDGSVLRTLSHPDPKLHFGYSVAGAGDVDADGCPDLLIGAPFGAREFYGPGIAEVRSGRDGESLFELSGELPGFGVSVAGVGDINGDGHDDIVVGTPPQKRTSVGQGWAHAYSGATGSQLYEYRSSYTGVWFGAAVAAAGDVDADGTPDVIVGGNYGGSPGLVRVFSGADGSVLHTWYGESAAADFGRAVGGAGDVDGDGHADLLVGVPDNRDDAFGRVLVFSGRDGSVIQALRGERPGQRFGTSVGSLGDVDGNGRAELIVGSPLGGPTRRGTVRVFWGGRTQDVTTFHGPRPGSFFGSKVVGVPGPVPRVGIGSMAGGGPWWAPVTK